MPVPDETAVTLLDGASIGLIRGENLFRGPVRDADERQGGVPDCAVFVLVTGGPEPVRCVNGNQGPRLLYETLQVFVRSDVQSAEKSFAEGQDLARNVWNALEAANATDFIKFDAQQSGPIYIGVDDTEHHRWSINIETLREE